MGGVNHQPCNRQGTKYLVLSTKLSRVFTLGRSKFELANVCLEDVLLSELEDGSPNSAAYQECIRHLDDASATLGHALPLLDALALEMHDKGYEPLPAFALYNSPAKARELGNAMANAGLLKLEAFGEIVYPQLDGAGFHAAIPILINEISQVKNYMVTLRLMMFSASHLADVGMIANELETNGGHNFRMAFMATYAQWNRAYDLFLASAAWSTEMWYQSMGHGSAVLNIEHQKMVG